MRLTKCDICGKVICDDEPRGIGYVSVTSEDKEGNYRHEAQDLCPECTDVLKDYMRVMRETKEPAK